MNRLMVFVRRLRRAWRAEFGGPQTAWERLEMPLPEAEHGLSPDKTLSLWVKVERTASGARLLPYIDAVQIDQRPTPTAYVDTEGSKFGKRSMRVGNMIPNGSFEADDQWPAVSDYRRIREGREG